MLAGLQISYLVFGIHGFYLWYLEYWRDHGSSKFNEPFWYNFGWVLAGLIFLFTVTISDFSGRWSWLQFLATSLALVANWATTRKWNWSWILWIFVNLVQAILFYHLGLWAQFCLQGVLALMSWYGYRQWQRRNV